MEQLICCYVYIFIMCVFLLYVSPNSMKKIHAYTRVNCKNCMQIYLICNLIFNIRKLIYFCTQIRIFQFRYGKYAGSIIAKKLPAIFRSRYNIRNAIGVFHR